MIRMLLPQLRINCLTWMFQESLFKQKPWSSTTVWSAERGPQSRTDRGTPSLVVTVRLRTSDSRVPVIRLLPDRGGTSLMMTRAGAPDVKRAGLFDVLTALSFTCSPARCGGWLGPSLG